MQKTPSSYHQSVMPQEVIQALQIAPSGVYVDATFGGGGHTRLILDQLQEKGRVFAFDQDKDAQRNLIEDDRLLFIQSNFQYLYAFLKYHRGLPVDGILADLGVSSFQIDNVERGFSYKSPSSLDMRMDDRLSRSALDILNRHTEEELESIFQNYGEVVNTKTLVRKIIEERRQKLFSDIPHFVHAIRSCIRGNEHQYLAKVFQALRIVVNDELGALETLMNQAHKALKENGILCVLTFHSLEDRVVKQHFKDHDKWELVFKKPVLPSEAEQKNNARSRSAKMRVALKKKSSL